DGGPQFEYDQNGNLSNDGVRYLSYDLANKVTHVQNGGSSVDFIYDAEGNRAVQEAAGGGQNPRTPYPGRGAPRQRLYQRTMKEDGGVEHTQFVYAPGEHYGNAFAIKTVHGGTTGAASTALAFNHFDHLGSVTAVSDEGGRVVSAAWGGASATVAGYDPWG